MTLLLGVIYLATAHELTARSDRILRLEAQHFAAERPDRLPAAVADAVTNSTSQLNRFALRDARGRVIAGNLDAALIGQDPPFDRPFDIAPAPDAPKSLRMLVVRTRFGETLAIARDITTLIDLRVQLLTIYVGSGLVIVSLVLLGGVLLSVAPLKRVRALQAAGREIAAGDLAARMPMLGRGDELDLLAGTVNVMVAEVARMIGQIKDVTDVIAHDLRSPLAHVHNRLTRLRQGYAPGSAEQETIAIALADLTRVLDRFAALLRVAELESSRRLAGFKTTYVQPLVEEVAELYQPLAEEREIALTTVMEPGMASAAIDPAIHGDDKLLFEAVSNLVDNAIKFTPAGGRVAIAVETRPHEVVIEVRDDGPGIPPDERDLVLRRFHRGRNANNVAGSGIGLSAVMAIVHMHGGTLELADAAPGLAARIHCPV